MKSGDVHEPQEGEPLWILMSYFTAIHQLAINFNKLQFAWIQANFVGSSQNAFLGGCGISIFLPF
jgi:hypothetical protein